MRRFLFFIPFACLFPLATVAQKWGSASINGQFIVPTGDYQNSGAPNGWGIQVTGLFNVKSNSRWSIGAIFSTAEPGKEVRKTYSTFGGFGDLKQISTTHTTQLLVAARYTAVLHPKIYVFGQLQSGIQLLTASIRVEEIQPYAPNQVVFQQSTTTYSPWVIGGGPGLLFFVDKRKRFAIESAVHYLYGTSSSYYLNPRFNTSGEVIFDKQKSATSHLQIVTGLHCRF